MLESKDRLLLNELQDNFPLSTRPYLKIAKNLRLSETKLISKLKDLKKKKIIRYIGGIFDTKKLGLQSSLVAMSVDEQRLKKVVGIINSYPQISHNYLRNSKFNLWFTLSAAEKSKLESLLSDIKVKTGINQILNLSTVRVFKIDGRFNLFNTEKPFYNADLRGSNADIRRYTRRAYLRPSACPEVSGSRSNTSKRRYIRDNLRESALKETFSKVDKKLVVELNRPLSITPRPFARMAKRLKTTEDMIVSKLKDYKKNGLLRRFGAILSHQNIGLRTNALVAWKVPNKRIESVAKILTSLPQITHCYLRNTLPQWPYNLYSMVHTLDKKRCNQLILAISRKAKIKDYQVLFSLKEFKKIKTNLNQILR